MDSKSRYDSSISLTKCFGSLPFLVAFPIIFLSHSLSTSFEYSYENTVLLNIFLASISLTIVILAFRMNVLPISRTNSLSGEPSKFNTIYLLSTFYIIFTSASFMPASRIAILYFGLFLNAWNLYTPLAFVFDCYSNYKEFYGLHVFLTYGLVLLGFNLISRKLRLTSVSNLLSSVDKPTVFGILILGAIALVLYNPSAFNFSMIGVCIATFIVVIISLQEFQMRDTRLSAVLISVIVETLMYVVLSRPPSLQQLINICLAIVITPDKSYLFEEHEFCSQNRPGSPILKELMEHSDTRAIFNFLLLNATFMFVQFLYSFRSKSLGLLSDSLHMALDCMSLILGLIAGVLSKQEIDPNGKYPFGLKNFEILAGFTNGTLLIGISGTIFLEAIGRLSNPVHLQKTTELIVVSILGLLVNLVGIFAFNHGHAHGHGHSHGHSHSHDTSEHHHEHSHGHEHPHSDNHHDSNDNLLKPKSDSHDHMNDNMRGIFLHIIADALGSVGVVISTILTKCIHWDGFDPIASIIIATMIFVSAVPLVKSTASTLLLSISKPKEDEIRNTLREITQIKGVKSFTTPRFWPDNNKHISGYVHVQVYRGENISYIKKQCEKMFESRHMDVMIQVENDYDDCWCRS